MTPTTRRRPDPHPGGYAKQKVVPDNAMTPRADAPPSPENVPPIEVVTPPDVVDESPSRNED